MTEKQQHQEWANKINAYWQQRGIEANAHVITVRDRDGKIVCGVRSDKFLTVPKIVNGEIVGKIFN